MMITIADVLDAAEVEAAIDALEAATFVDGAATAGAGARCRCAINKGRGFKRIDSSLNFRRIKHICNGYHHAFSVADCAILSQSELFSRSPVV